MTRKSSARDDGALDARDCSGASLAASLGGRVGRELAIGDSRLECSTMGVQR